MCLFFASTSFAVDRFTGTISGRVYDHETNNPLAGVSVTLRPNTYEHGAVDYIVTTDAQGRYSVTGMKCYYTIDGTWSTLNWLSYTVSASSEGYQDYKSQTLAFSRGYYSITCDVALTPNVIPSQTGIITGIVTDARTGKPLTGGIVLIKDVAYGLEYNVSTDSQGRFTAVVQRSKISGGMGVYWYRYKIILNWHWQGYESYEEDVAFSETVTTIENDVVLKPQDISIGTITGIVTDSETGKPIANGKK